MVRIRNANEGHRNPKVQMPISLSKILPRYYMVRIRKLGLLNKKDGMK
jgi:hypothetical protein